MASMWPAERGRTGSSQPVVHPRRKRHLGPWNVGDHQVVLFAHHFGGCAYLERVQSVGAKPAMSASERAATARSGVLVRLGVIGHLMQPHQRVGLSDRQALQAWRDLTAQEVGSPSSSVTLIGTSAVRELPGMIDSPRVSNQERSPPAIMANTTSLIVWRCSWRTAWRSLRDATTVAKRRCSDTSPVNGESKTDAARAARQRPAPPTRRPIPPTASPTATATPSALVSAPRKFSIAMAGSCTFSKSAQRPTPTTTAQAVGAGESSSAPAPGCMWVSG